MTIPWTKKLNFCCHHFCWYSEWECNTFWTNVALSHLDRWPCNFSESKEIYKASFDFWVAEDMYVVLLGMGRRLYLVPSRQSLGSFFSGILFGSWDNGSGLDCHKFLYWSSKKGVGWVLSQNIPVLCLQLDMFWMSWIIEKHFRILPSLTNSCDKQNIFFLLSAFLQNWVL